MTVFLLMQKLKREIPSSHKKNRQHYINVHLIFFQGKPLYVREVRTGCEVCSVNMFEIKLESTCIECVISESSLPRNCPTPLRYCPMTPHWLSEGRKNKWNKTGSSTSNYKPCNLYVCLALCMYVLCISQEPFNQYASYLLSVLLGTQRLQLDMWHIQC